MVYSAGIKSIKSGSHLNLIKKRMSYSQKSASPTEMEYEITIPSSDFEKELDNEMSKLASLVKVSGFRPGKAPTQMIGDERKAEARKKALETVISREAGEILKKENIVPAMPPSVSIKTFGEGKPVVLSLHISMIPSITLPELSKLTTKRPEVTVEKKDVEQVEKHLWQEHRGKFKDKTDSWVASVAPKLGFTARTMKELRTEIEKAVEHEKRRIVEQKYSHDVLAEAIEKAHIQIPEKLIQYEAEEREQSFLSTLHQMNKTVEDFMKERKVTIEEFREQWKKDAKEAVETDVLLSEYAKLREVKLSDEDLEKEVAVIKTQSKNPDDTLFDNPEWRGYIRRVLLKRKAVQAFLDEVETSRSGSKGT